MYDLTYIIDTLNIIKNDKYMWVNISEEILGMVLDEEDLYHCDLSFNTYDKNLKNITFRYLKLDDPFITEYPARENPLL